ncbi:MAG: fumarylacetoacetate hydrolase family protein [Methylobacteriaceae bacterium]|nr:fumarylacetoacetate hydrolase family protein [Methylobacteriaceae bacterium]
MKLVRYGAHGSEEPGLIDADGNIRALGEIIPELADEALSPDSLREIAGADHTLLPIVDGSPRIGACVGYVGNFVAVGLNYADHAAETGAAIPTEPILFNKAPSCIVGPYDDIVLPKGSVKTDWEVELAIVMGSRASYVDEADALDYVAGFCICHDVSERTFQIERGGQWMKGKGCPTFGPLGPWLVTADEIADLQKLDMWLDVNGERMQTGSTATMIFGVKHLVSYISQFMVLEAGDVITTGTPPGVGMGKKPQRFLKAGDVVALGIAGLGEQRSRVVAYRGS